MLKPYSLSGIIYECRHGDASLDVAIGSFQAKIPNRNSQNSERYVTIGNSNALIGARNVKIGAQTVKISENNVKTVRITLKRSK